MSEQPVDAFREPMRRLLDRASAEVAGFTPRVVSRAETMSAAIDQIHSASAAFCALSARFNTIAKELEEQAQRAESALGIGEKR